MVLGDAVSKLETFEWILSHISRSITWSLFTLKASYLAKWSILTWSFMWWCPFIDWLKFETCPSSLLNFGTAYCIHFSFSLQGRYFKQLIWYLSFLHGILVLFNWHLFHLFWKETEKLLEPQLLAGLKRSATSKVSGFQQSVYIYSATNIFQTDTNCFV